MAEAQVAAGTAVALVAGATGLVGRAVLAALLADKRYTKIHSVGRRPLTGPIAQHRRLSQHGVDFKDLSALAALPAVDEVFIALGTTIKVAGSQAAFRAVDFDAVVALARAARARGATRLGVVSAMGADPRSPLFYSRVKGEMEVAVAKLGFQSVVIARPSMLAGDREALHQPTRNAEKMALLLSRVFKPLIPADYRAIAADDVAAGLVQAVQHARPGVTHLLSGALQGKADPS